MPPHLSAKVLVCAFFAAPGLYGLFQILVLYRRIKISEAWSEIVATITVASVEDHKKIRGGRDYWAEFTYAFAVDGYDCVGKSRIESFWRDWEVAEKSVAAHPVGSTLIVYYNPENPEEFISEYDRTIKLYLIKTLLALIFPTMVIAASFLP
jgi:hypothetical protein